MTLSKLLFLPILSGIFFNCWADSTCHAQGWLDYARNAQPKVNVGAPNNFTPSSGFPSTSYPSTSFPSTSAPQTSSLNANPTNSGMTSNGSSGVGPMPVPNRKDWKLGVFVQNTDIGARVTQVEPGSAGQQAGLEPNDIIVAVGGSRIGAYDNRIVELAEELRRNTDNMGRVSLLVLDSRQQRLQALPVSMNSTSSSMTGSVTTRDRMQLPYGAVLTVQLQNASKPYYEILGGKSVTQANSGVPIPFELNFDPRYIDPRDQYQLIAFISSGNQELYRLSQPMPINPNALGQPINLTLEQSQGGGFASTGSVNNNQGNVVSVGYPSQVDSNAVNQMYIKILGRVPSAKETLAWNSYLQGGNSINDVAAKLLSSPQYRDRFSNESAYFQQVIQLTSNRVPSQQELSFWLTRLQATGSPEVVVGEILKKNP